MAEITRALIARVGVDLAKNVIQVHAIDGAGRRVVGRAFKRDAFLAWCAQLPGGCLVAMARPEPATLSNKREQSQRSRSPAPPHPRILHARRALEDALTGQTGSR